MSRVRRAILLVGEVRLALNRNTIYLTRPTTTKYEKATSWLELRPNHLLWVAEDFSVTAKGKGFYKVDNKSWAVADPRPVLACKGKRGNFSMPREISRLTLKVVECVRAGACVELKCTCYRKPVDRVLAEGK